MGPDYHRISFGPDLREVQSTIPQVRMSAKSQGPKKKRWCGLSLYTWSHILGSLWIAPITALLVLNLKSHVIGASIWCPRGRCNAEAYGDNAIAKARDLDAEDHNILGGLQVASKALEAWFMFVATGLIYDVAFSLAKSSGGLPIGYFFTHLEFAHIKNLLNRLLWTSALPNGDLLPSEPAGTWRLYVFAIFATFLTILTNLMGPATAVLVLPSLTWVDEEHAPIQVFGAFAASSPPGGETMLTGCDDNHFSTRNYTCTSAVYGPSLDNWVAQLMSTAAQWGQDSDAFLLGTTQEGNVETTINITEKHLSWVPLRQTLRDLSHDLSDLGSYVTGRVESNNKRTAIYKQPAFNNSLETILLREGPSLGMAANCFAAGLTVKDVADNRQIRCLEGYNAAANNSHTKCYRAGRGWAETNGVARFYLVDSDDKEKRSYVDIYSSDKAVYLDLATEFGSRMNGCINGSAADCDWDQLFAAEVHTDLKNSTTNAMVSEYAHPLLNSSRYCCEAFVYTAFPTYAVNTARWANPLSLVNLIHLPVETDKNFNDTPIAVHPDWVLAAWSVANNGTVDDSREAGNVLARLIAALNDERQWNDPIYNYADPVLVYLHLYSMAQTLSLIDYSFYNDTASLAAAAQARDEGKPIFSKWATLRVWAYGLSGRTPKLGVVVAIIGCVCVLLRVILAFTLGIKHEHSILELFVAALEHHPTGEFDELDDKATMAKVRYLMQDGEKRPKFVSQRDYSCSNLKSGYVA